MSKELISKIEQRLHGKAAENWEDKIDKLNQQLRNLFKWNSTGYEENVLLKEVFAAMHKYKDVFLKSEYSKLEKEFFSEIGKLKTLIEAVCNVPQEVEEELEDE